jgi:4-amino-4-deoxy-L-arabinose transferase-like glycosyltransferase
MLIAAFMTVAWFAALDTRMLQHPDEGRYAEIAREMAVSGDWLTPPLDGLKYFEKPPLQYWLTATAYRALEIDEWTSRIAPAAGGYAAAVAVGVTTAALAGPLAGAFAALVMASFLIVIVTGHFGSLDAFFNGWLTLALCGFLRAQTAATERSTRNRMLFTWAMLAAATLTKGPVALVIAGGSLFFYTLATRDFGPWKRLHLLPGIVVYLLLTAPWFVLVARANPEFLHFFFIHEHVERFLSTEHNRPGPIWYFVPIFGLGAMPWLALWLRSLVPAWIDGSPAPNGFSWERFVFVWGMFVFVFFSLSGSKLPSYILPQFAAVAMLLGCAIVRHPPRTLFRWNLPQIAVSVALLAAATVGYGTVVRYAATANTPAALFLAYRPWLTLAAALMCAGSLLAAFFFRLGSERGKALGVAALAMLSLAAFQVAFVGHNAFAPIRSADLLVRDFENRLGATYDRGAPVFQVAT